MPRIGTFVWHITLLLSQGLFEYVKPAWQKRLKPVVKDFELKSFGGTIASRPAIANVKDSVELQSNGVTMPG